MLLCWILSKLPQLPPRQYAPLSGLTSESSARTPWTGSTFHPLQDSNIFTAVGDDGGWTSAQQAAAAWPGAYARPESLLLQPFQGTQLALHHQAERQEAPCAARCGALSSVVAPRIKVFYTCS